MRSSNAASRSPCSATSPSRWCTPSSTPCSPRARSPSRPGSAPTVPRSPTPPTPSRSPAALGVPASACAMVGDSPVDVATDPQRGHGLDRGHLGLPQPSPARADRAYAPRDHGRRAARGAAALTCRKLAAMRAGLVAGLLMLAATGCGGNEARGDKAEPVEAKPVANRPEPAEPEDEPKPLELPTTDTLRGVIEQLSSDAFAGRRPGTEGGRKAAQFHRSADEADRPRAGWGRRGVSADRDDASRHPRPRRREARAVGGHRRADGARALARDRGDERRGRGRPRGQKKRSCSPATGSRPRSTSGDDYAGVDVEGKFVVVLVGDSAGDRRAVRRRCDDLLRPLDLQVRPRARARRGGLPGRARARARVVRLGRGRGVVVGRALRPAKGRLATGADAAGGLAAPRCRRRAGEAGRLEPRAMARGCGGPRIRRPSARGAARGEVLRRRPHDRGRQRDRQAHRDRARAPRRSRSRRTGITSAPRPSRSTAIRSSTEPSTMPAASPGCSVPPHRSSSTHRRARAPSARCCSSPPPPKSKACSEVGTSSRTPPCRWIRIVAALNLDSMNVAGRTRSVVVVGARPVDARGHPRRGSRGAGSERRPRLQAGEAAATTGPTTSRSRCGGCRRCTSAAARTWRKAARRRARRSPRCGAERYHTVRDEYDPSWSLEGTLQDVQAMTQLVLRVGGAEHRPAWKPASEFADRDG